MELVFDLGAAYDIEAIHVWNYFGEQLYVDEISVSFRNESGASISSLTLNPIKGVNSAGNNNNNIVAETFMLNTAAMVRVSEVSMLLSSSTTIGAGLDFQNIGFTASSCTDNGAVPSLTFPPSNKPLSTAPSDEPPSTTPSKALPSLTPSIPPSDTPPSTAPSEEPPSTAPSQGNNDVALGAPPKSPRHH